MSKPRCAAALLMLMLALPPAAVFAASPTSLATAAERGDQKLVRALIQQGADVNAPSVDGSTALHRAVYADQPEIASVLLKAGAKVAAADRYGVTPLSLAAINGNPK